MNNIGKKIKYTVRMSKKKWKKKLEKQTGILDVNKEKKEKGKKSRSINNDKNKIKQRWFSERKKEKNEWQLKRVRK